MRPDHADLLSQAIRHAALAHKDQRRRDGEPYFIHLMRVMLRIPSDEGLARVVAVLHDLKEDHSTWWDRIEYEYPPEVREAVELLTHKHGCDDMCYRAYILRLRSNRLASRVKRADLEDNLNGQPGIKRDLYLWALAKLGEGPGIERDETE